MKLQALIIPEKLVDVLTLVIVISIVFGMYVLFSRFRIAIRKEEDLNILIFNFAQVFLGDKCILYKDGSYGKGVLDYEKIIKKISCIEKLDNRSISIFFDHEKIIYNEDCEKKTEKIIFPVVIYKENRFKTGKLVVC